MAVIAAAVKTVSRLPTGIQIVPGANIAVMSVAHAPGLDFISAEAYIQSANLQRTLSKLPILHDRAQRASCAR
jgi:predicted TIM-barrel enzyme